MPKTKKLQRPKCAYRGCPHRQANDLTTKCATHLYRSGQATYKAWHIRSFRTRPTRADLKTAGYFGVGPEPLPKKSDPKSQLAYCNIRGNRG